MPVPYANRFGRKIKPLFSAFSKRQWKCRWLIWPKGMSYPAWQNFLKKFCWFIGKNNSCRSLKTKKRKGRSHRHRKFSKREIRKKKKRAQRETAESVKLDSVELQDDNDIKLELITLLKQFCKRKQITRHIEKTVPDYRNQDLITYSKQSIMMSALAIFFFRMGSGNSYDTKGHDNDEKYSKANIARFIESPEERVPVIKTVEKFLRSLEEGVINDLMIAFFKDLQCAKFFKSHPEIMPGDFFLLAADCVHTHTYDHPHHTDADGNNDCEYCLKRVYIKRSEDEQIRWFHNTLVLSFVVHPHKSYFCA